MTQGTDEYQILRTLGSIFYLLYFNYDHNHGAVDFNIKKTTPTERCLGFILNNTKTDFTVLILHVHSIQNWFRLNPTCGFP